MKKTMRLITSFIIVSFLLTPMPIVFSADNILTVNGSFEENYNGWSLGSVKATWQPEGAEDTQGSVFIDVTNGYNDISQKINFQKGRNYYITVNLKLAEVNQTYTTTESQVLISYDKGTEYLMAGTIINSNGWTKLETVYNCSSAESSVKFGSGKLYVRIGPNPQNNYSFDYYIDEFHCVELDNSVLTKNGGFEYGIAGWTKANCNVTQAANGANGTEKCGKVEVTGTNTSAVLAQNIAFKPDVYYKISIWIKLEDGSNTAQLLISHTNSGGDTGTEYLAVGTPVDANWKNITVYYKYDTSSPGRTGPSGIGNLSARIGQNNAQLKLNYYLDELEVTEMTNEFVKNSSFDFDKSIWRFNNVNNSNLVTDTPTASRNALRLSMSAAGGTLLQKISLLKDVNYTVSFWARGEGTPFEITPIIMDEANSIVPLFQPFAVDGAVWTRYVFSFVPQKDFIDKDFTFTFSTNELLTYYLDEIEIYQSKPRIENLTVNVETLIGNSLDITYNFQNVALSSPEGGSTYILSYGNSFSWNVISRGTVNAQAGIELPLIAKYKNSNIKLEITPIDANGVNGATVTKVLGKIKQPYEIQMLMNGAFVGNGSIKPIINIKNNTSEGKSLSAFLTVYNENGTMVGIVADKQYIESNSKVDFNFQTISLPQTVDGYTAKIMLWESGTYNVTNMISFVKGITFTNAH